MMHGSATGTPSSSARASTPSRQRSSTPVTNRFASPAAAPAPSPCPAAPTVVGNRERVQVVVRCRPISERELTAGHKCCISIDTERRTVEVHNVGGRFAADNIPKSFTFDRVYNEKSTQRQIYKDVAYSIVHSVMCGYNGTVLAYGQTASGKTYTMEGCDHSPDLWGIIPNAFEHIFQHIRQSQSSDSFLVRISYLEIYNEEIRDLLSPATSKKLELKESVETGVYVKNLTSLTVNSFADIRQLLMLGKKNRAIGATAMNQDSSRSHSIFTITVESSTCDPTGGKTHVRVGKLNLVDLAGSERLSKTGATGERFKEMTKINWSLSALGNVISALVDGKSSHIPYRDSKLTRLLQDSLGGNTRTVMVANIGPADYNYEESISTLRYANRAKNIKNKPHVNEDPKDAIISEFQSEIQRLRAQIQASHSDMDYMKRIHSLEQEKQMFSEQLQHYKERFREVASSQQMSDQAIACLKADFENKAQLQLESLKAEKERNEEEKERVINQLLIQLREMEHQNQELSKGKEDHALLESKLKVLEEKLLRGTNNDKLTQLNKPRNQESEPMHSESRIQENKTIDEERQRKIAELEEAQLMAEEKCSTMEEELESKTRKLRRLMSRYQQSKLDVAALRTEIQDTIHEFHQERADLLWSIRSLEQQHQLKNLIIERFIPPEEVTKIMQRVSWDDENETWIFRSAHNYAGSGLESAPMQRPPSAVGRSRPTCQKSLQCLAQGTSNPRYLDENILKLELDLPERATYDYYDPVERIRAESQIHQCFKDCDKSSPYLSYDSQPTFHHYSSRQKSSHMRI
uniref:Kinesin-like protein n=1 Tax=Marsilea vestita TaxID=59764 RepID=A0A142KW89_MARVE|nr:kinesin 2 protein [Marsilea vestita]